MDEKNRRRRDICIPPSDRPPRKGITHAASGRAHRRMRPARDQGSRIKDQDVAYGYFWKGETPPPHVSPSVISRPPSSIPFDVTPPCTRPASSVMQYVQPMEVTISIQAKSELSSAASDGCCLAPSLAGPGVWGATARSGSPGGGPINDTVLWAMQLRWVFCGPSGVCSRLVSVSASVSSGLTRWTGMNEFRAIGPSTAQESCT